MSRTEDPFGDEAEPEFQYSKEKREKYKDGHGIKSICPTGKGKE